MLYQEDNTELDDEWLNSNERLTYFSKTRYNIIDKVKGSVSPYVQGT